MSWTQISRWWTTRRRRSESAVVERHIDLLSGARLIAARVRRGQRTIDRSALAELVDPPYAGDSDHESDAADDRVRFPVARLPELRHMLRGFVSRGGRAHAIRLGGAALQRVVQTLPRFVHRHVRGSVLRPLRAGRGVRVHAMQPGDTTQLACGAVLNVGAEVRIQLVHRAEALSLIPRIMKRFGNDAGGGRRMVGAKPALRICEKSGIPVAEYPLQ